jgi:hypothetical protein
MKHLMDGTMCANIHQKMEITVETYQATWLKPQRF